MRVLFIFKQYKIYVKIKIILNGGGKTKYKTFTVSSDNPRSFAIGTA